MVVISIEKVDVIPSIATHKTAEPSPSHAIGTSRKPRLERSVSRSACRASKTFDPATFYWHAPIELPYGASSPFGIVDDVYVQVATGEFAGRPNTEEFRQRAKALAVAHEIK